MPGATQLVRAGGGEGSYSPEEPASVKETKDPGRNFVLAIDRRWQTL